MRITCVNNFSEDRFRDTVFQSIAGHTQRILGQPISYLKPRDCHNAAQYIISSDPRRYLDRLCRDDIGIEAYMGCVGGELEDFKRIPILTIDKTFDCIPLASYMELAEDFLNNVNIRLEDENQLVKFIQILYAVGFDSSDVQALPFNTRSSLLTRVVEFPEVFVSAIVSNYVNIRSAPLMATTAKYLMKKNVADMFWIRLPKVDSTALSIYRALFTLERSDVVEQRITQLFNVGGAHAVLESVLEAVRCIPACNDDPERAFMKAFDIMYSESGFEDFIKSLPHDAPEINRAEMSGITDISLSICQLMQEWDSHVFYALVAELCDKGLPCKWDASTSWDSVELVTYAATPEQAASVLSKFLCVDINAVLCMLVTNPAACP